jgi:hypothetical protein
MLNACAAILFVVLASQGGSTAPTVEEVLSAHVAARGGAEAWRVVTSLVRSQTNQQLTVETAWVRAAPGQPDRARMDQNSAEYGIGETRAFDGQTGWMQETAGLRQLSSVEVQELREDAAGMVELLAAKDLGLQVSMAGADSLDGRPVWKLAVNLRSGRKLMLWLDAKTWLEVGRSKVVTAPDGGAVEIWTALGDYRKVSGVELPHAINNSAATYKINVPLAESYFKKPATSLPDPLPAAR